MTLRNFKIDYHGLLGFIGFLGFLGFDDPWYFLFFLFFLFFLGGKKFRQKQHSDILENVGMSGLMKRQTRKKVEHLQKIRDFMDYHERTTNDEIQDLLGVSDATAERYLNELEKQGFLSQKGQNKGIFYEKND